MPAIKSRAKSEALFAQAKNVIPGGVNSPVRAFRAVGGNPVFIDRAEGVHLYDEDGNAYIELINSWGPMLFGHAHPAITEAVTRTIGQSPSFGAPTAREIIMAETLVSMVPSLEKVRMVNSGTEATMAAIRVARGYTGRAKILKFEGCYHGHGDSFLIAAGSGAITLGVPDSPGVTQGVAQDTLTAPFNDLGAVEQILAANKDQVAALILEPVVGNMGLVPPAPGFLQGLRDLCTAQGIVLIFDEVMTGFRLAKGGAQELYGITPDMTTLGKIIGGGLPVGAYGGKAEIMNHVAPAGPVYQAGTLSGNPIAMAAGLAMMKLINNTPDLYSALDAKGAKLEALFNAGLEKTGIKGTVNRVGSMITLFFAEGPIQNFSDAKRSNTAAFGTWFNAMLNRGVYLAPSQYEALFLSYALTDQDLDYIGEAHLQAMQEVAEKHYN